VRATVLLAVAGALLAAAPSAASAAPSRRCRPEGSVVVVKTPGARVFARWARKRSGGGRVRAYFGCEERKGRAWPFLRSEVEGQDGYSPVRLSGRFLAYGMFEACRRCRDSRTVLVRQDLRSGRRRTLALDRVGDGRETTLWDLELARDGRVAFIAQAEGGRAVVEAIGGDGRRRVLDGGPGVQGRSLYRRGDVVRWYRGRTLRKARLG
jgi:hypothetical protein